MDTPNAIVNLPEMMRTAQPDGDKALLSVVPDVVIDGPEFNPEEYLDPKTVLEIRNYAEKQVGAPGFNAEFLMSLIADFDIGDVPQMDEMLKSLRMQDHGEMAKTLQDTTKHMRQISGKIPMVDPEWVKKVEEGKLWFRDVAARVKSMNEEIKEAIDYWGNFLHEFDEADQELRGQQELMREIRLRNDSIAEREFVRAMRTIQLCTTLSVMRQEVGVRLKEISDELTKGPNEALMDEQRKLESLGPILINTLGSLIPFIPVTTNNGRMFILQRNDNAFQEHRLFLFRTFGIAQWKANTLVRLNAALNRTADLALSIAQKAMNEEGRKGSQEFVEEASRFAASLKEFMLEMETCRAQADAIAEASEILTEGVKAADQNAHMILREIEANTGKVEQAHKNWSEALQNILVRKPAS